MLWSPQEAKAGRAEQSAEKVEQVTDREKGTRQTGGLRSEVGSRLALLRAAWVPYAHSNALRMAWSGTTLISHQHAS